MNIFFVPSSFPDLWQSCSRLFKLRSASCLCTAVSKWIKLGPREHAHSIKTTVQQRSYAGERKLFIASLVQRMWWWGRGTKRCEPSRTKNSLPPALSSLPSCDGVQFSLDSIRVFNGGIKIRENRRLWIFNEKAVSFPPE